MNNASTTRMSRVGLLSASFFAAAIGCGGGSGGDPIPLEDLGEQVATAFCERAFNCCTEAELAEEFGGTAPADVGECVTTFGAFFDFDDEIDAVEAGTVTYDEGTAGDCLAELQAAGCGAADEDLECDPFTGSVATDGACELDEACLDGARCNDGICVDEVGLGDECPDSFCDDGSSCTDGTCVAPPAEGQECPGFVCEAGAFCDSAAQPATCVALLADGEACNGSYECESQNCGETSGECESPTCDGL